VTRESPTFWSGSAQEPTASLPPQANPSTNRRAEIEAEMRKPRVDSLYWREPAMQDEYRALLEEEETRPRAPLFPRPGDVTRKAEIEGEMRKGRQGEYFRPGSYMPDEYRAILERELGEYDEA
jgi:hypothetical protein